MWRPSTFWEIKYFNSLTLYIATRDMWVNEGTALFISTTFLFGTYLTPWAFFSHAPGPVLRTVLTPDLKSGTPHAVEIPAPVKAIKWLLPNIRLATCLTFY